MKSNYLWLIIGIIIVLALFGLFYVIKAPSPQSTTGPTSVPTAQQNVTSGPQQTSIQPINTNVGSIGGIDLSPLAIEGNDSILNASTDGTSDVNSLSSSDSFNSAIDSVNNPTQ